MDTRYVDFIQFTAQVGGLDVARCFGAERRQESLLLLYSNNAGISWALVEQMQSTDYFAPRYT